jgi:uncharacterized protein YndB with AHSA1/START domain
MKSPALAVIFLATALALGGAAPDEISSPETKAEAASLMAGKQKTGRTIFLEATVPALPAEVFRLWTSKEGVGKFFAPGARIDLKPGGRYEILFAPASDPEGNSHGTKGARILRLVRDRELAFEWITFAGDESLGRNAPPFAPPAERNIRPLPTWVELAFDPVPGQPDQTHLRFAHYGFREGEKWEQSYDWFGRAWKSVLDELVSYCQHRKSTEEKP